MINTTKKAAGKGNTQVGQNLLNEKVRINHLTINIQLSGPSGFEAFKKLIKKLKIFNHEEDKTLDPPPDNMLKPFSFCPANPKKPMEEHPEQNPNAYHNEWSNYGT